MNKLYEDSETGCCPRFDPAPWDEKEINWKSKLFVKDYVRCIFHILLNFGKVIVRNLEKIKAADALPPQPLMLSDEKSLWGADIFIAASKEILGVELERISGTFLSKVFEGPYKDAGKWVKAITDYVKSRGKESKKIYFFYTTCSKCTKFYSKNYTVLIARM